MRQPTDLDCLPTCVQSVLQYQFDQQVSIEEARALCNAEPGGVWSNSLRALRAAGYSANEIARGDETDEEALNCLYDLVEINELPVIVQLPTGMTAAGQSFFHALVVVGTADDGTLVIVMNPDNPTGFDTWASKTFFRDWATTDFNGFILVMRRPTNVNTPAPPITAPFPQASPPAAFTRNSERF